MWVVIRYESKDFRFFINNIKKNIKEEFVFYNPKIKLEKFYKNKIISKEINLINGYIFCYNKNFKDRNYLNSLTFIKGLKYILSGFQNSQNEIKDFINRCKNSENDKGYLSANFFDIELNKKYKFSSGPFLNHIFKVMEIHKNKFKIAMGNKITTVKRDYLFNSL
jgi:hypothetical protein